MQGAKETASNVAASAKSGLEKKAKVTAQQNVEKMTTTDPVKKEMAKQKKEERIVEEELKKRKEWERNTAGTRADATPIGESQSYLTTGERGQSTGMHQMSALPGHGTGEPGERVVEGVVPSHPVAVATGTDRPSTAHNPGVCYQ